MTPEGKVKAKLKKYLKEIGAWQYWPVSNGMGRHGIPDCIICYKGHFLSVECKAPGKHPTALQMKEGESIDAAEGVWLVFDGDDMRLDVLKEIISRIRSGSWRGVKTAEKLSFWQALSSSAQRTYGHLQPREALAALLEDHETTARQDTFLAAAEIAEQYALRTPMPNNAVAIARELREAAKGEKCTPQSD